MSLVNSYVRLHFLETAGMVFTRLFEHFIQSLIISVGLWSFENKNLINDPPVPVGFSPVAHIQNIYYEIAVNDAKLPPAHVNTD